MLDNQLGGKGISNPAQNRAENNALSPAVSLVEDQLKAPLGNDGDHTGQRQRDAGADAPVPAFSQQQHCQTGGNNGIDDNNQRSGKRRSVLKTGCKEKAVKKYAGKAEGNNPRPVAAKQRPVPLAPGRDPGRR